MSYHGNMKKWKIISFVLMFVIVVLLGLYLFIFRWERVTYFTGSEAEFDSMEEAEELSTSPWSEDRSCNIAGINFHGDLMTYVPYADQDYDYASGEDLLWLLDEAEEDKNIKAVILEIDSHGGSPVAAEELANKIKSMQKPVIVVGREVMASAGYWVASAADRVYASELSDVGSIGVTMSYVDESKLNDMEGYTWNSLSTGKFKDSGTTQKALTAEERALFERDIAIIFDKFVRVVSENRGIPVEKVRELADGSTMLGTMALENGLIDAIGSIPEAESYLATTLAIEPETCW
jgi:protease-4